MERRKITRKHLVGKVGKTCDCNGIVDRRGHADYNYGINSGNKERYLIRELNVDDEFVHHAWIDCPAFSGITMGTRVFFTAVVIPYRNRRGIISYGLTGIKMVEKPGSSRDTYTCRPGLKRLEMVKNVESWCQPENHHASPARRLGIKKSASIDFHELKLQTFSTVNACNLDPVLFLSPGNFIMIIQDGKKSVIFAQFNVMIYQELETGTFYAVHGDNLATRLCTNAKWELDDDDMIILIHSKIGYPLALIVNNDETRKTIMATITNFNTGAS